MTDSISGRSALITGGGSGIGLGTAQQNFDFLYSRLSADNPFWSVVIADPGPEEFLDIPVYWRGGMTLHQLRLSIGDDSFFRLLRTWTRIHAGGKATTGSATRRRGSSCSTGRIWARSSRPGCTRRPSQICRARRTRPDRRPPPWLPSRRPHRRR